MPRYINADALLEEIPPGKIVSSDSMRCTIITAPTADVKIVRHGTWVVSGIFDDFLKCSVCGFDCVMFIASVFNYCPCCGAIMHEEDSKEKIDDTDSKTAF